MYSKLPCFETLREMAEERPAELESLRRELTGRIIAPAPPQARRRLRGLQFQIEARCRTAKTPYAACLHVSRMMHDSLEQLRGALNGQELPRRSRPSAPVIPFPGRTAQ